MKLVSRNKKYLLLLWGTNGVLALVLTIPIFSMLFDNLQHSSISDDLALNFNYVWYLQFRYLYENLFDKLPLLFYSIVGMNALIQTFYSGGLITVFNNPKKNHVSDFFYGGVKYWYRFMKVTLVTLVLFTIIFLINDLIGNWLTYLSQITNSVLLDLSTRSARYLILLILIGIITLITDYVCVNIALEDQKKVRNGFKDIFKFIRHRNTLIFMVFLSVSIIGALGAIVYNVIVIYVPRSPFYFLILTFILQQLLIIFRLSITMLFYSTEVFLYKDQNAEVVSEFN
jgi:hypothetical protein